MGADAPRGSTPGASEPMWSAPSIATKIAAAAAALRGSRDLRLAAQHA